MSTVIQRQDVPIYLRESSFYESLDENDEEMFEVPAECFKPNMLVETDADLTFLLRSTSFWGVYSVPVEVMCYILIREQDIEEIDIFPEYHDLLQNILAVKFADAESTITTAIHGRLGVEAVQCLYEQYQFELFPSACVVAAIVNDVKSLCPWDSATTDAAIVHNSMQCLQYAIREGCSLSEKCMEIAATTGHVPIMQYLHSHGVAYPNRVYVRCANLAVLQHLREAGCDWNIGCCEHFARNNMLDCLTYAHENGCGWDENTTTVAAEFGHLDCLRYAHQHGCIVSQFAMFYALKQFHWLIVWYLYTNNCPSLVLKGMLFLALTSTNAVLFPIVISEWNMITITQLVFNTFVVICVVVGMYGTHFTHVLPFRQQMELLVVLAVLTMMWFMYALCVSIVVRWNT